MWTRVRVRVRVEHHWTGPLDRTRGLASMKVSIMAIVVCGQGSGLGLGLSITGPDYWTGLDDWFR